MLPTTALFVYPTKREISRVSWLAANTGALGKKAREEESGKNFFFSSPPAHVHSHSLSSSSFVVSFRRQESKQAHFLPSSFSSSPSSFLYLESPSPFLPRSPKSERVPPSKVPFFFPDPKSVERRGVQEEEAESAHLRTHSERRTGRKKREGGIFSVAGTPPPPLAAIRFFHCRLFSLLVYLGKGGSPPLFFSVPSCPSR